MAKKTLITGDEGTGKTTKAKELVQGKNTAFISRLTEIKSKVDENTEVIVVSSGNNISLDRLTTFIFSPSISYRKPYGAIVIKLPMPDIIVIDNRFKNDTKGFDEVITCH